MDITSYNTEENQEEVRPALHIGQHDSSRTETLTDLQYGQVLNSGFRFVTAPITNARFHERIVKLVDDSLAQAQGQGKQTNGNRIDPIVDALTPDDTTLFPGVYTSGFVCYASPWIDLCSPNHVIASISRQVLNLEVDYANFCGVRSIIVPGPRQDAAQAGNGLGVAQYARAIQEALLIGTRISLIIHLPMYREPGLEEKIAQLSIAEEEGKGKENAKGDIDIFTTWDSWHVIRTVCDYNDKLFVALRIPRVLPAKELQTRWFSEPLQYLTYSPATFQENKAGHPSLGKAHQDLIGVYMRLKNAPYFLLCDAGPEVKPDPPSITNQKVPDVSSSSDFPSLGSAPAAVEEAFQPPKNEQGILGHNAYLAYFRHLERQQEPYSDLELSTLTNFQDWLQSPLQPLADNLESVTYEVFEGDPVKYERYEAAIVEALTEWIEQAKPTSSLDGEVVIAVAGSGRGPLVTRALRASKITGVPVKVWAVEKNPNAYVYLLRQNQTVWEGKVSVVKTDMRAWKGPVLSSSSSPSNADSSVQHGKVDILVSELLGSFGDNELSPECLDGIQHVLSPTHGISIPSSYTAHVSPISTPRLFADIKARSELGGAEPCNANAFNTPWVVRLFALDFVAARGVPDHPRFQQAWEFAHPLTEETMDQIRKRKEGGVVGGGGGCMQGGVGANDHNARSCCLTFVCRHRGVVHGLAGYFEAVLYERQLQRRQEQREEGEEVEVEVEMGEDGEVKGAEKPMVELSILPEQIDRKSKDMVSWFPIFFPLKQPLYFPADSELEVTMWRQTDDARVWYEWMVEAFRWVSATERIKVGGSELCSSRKVACLM
ncbi:PRMT5 arginine-N-methyltransferase-domain-containing protein [Astrocystis sublimbata]|nr:PRMT5 arginine-N-methyltransferase-domain-containing protein [Astrocystis sublimbata]